MDHPAALHRLKVGVPATVEHSSEAGPETGKWVAETTQVCLAFSPSHSRIDADDPVYLFRASSHSWTPSNCAYAPKINCTLFYRSWLLGMQGSKGVRTGRGGVGWSGGACFSISLDVD